MIASQLEHAADQVAASSRGPDTVAITPLQAVSTKSMPDHRLSALAGSSLQAIVACAGKGGCGKSTTLTNLAVLAQQAGYRVGIIDADPQRSSFEWQLVRGNQDIRVCRCNDDQLEGAVELARRCGIQIVFIDMPPGARHALVAARHADLVIIPTRPTLFDLRVTRSVIQLLRSTQQAYAVVINAAPARRRDGDAPAVRETREALASVTKRVWPRQITHRMAVVYATLTGAGVAEAEPAGLAAQEYAALWNALRADLKLNEGPKCRPVDPF
jgi:chromosome partitioning protein